MRRRVRSLIVIDEDLLVPAPRGRGIGQQLSLTRPLEANKPEGRFIDSLAHGEDAVVLQDHGLAVPEGGSDPSPLFLVYHDAPEVTVHAVRLVEPARVLRQHLKLAPESREGLPVHAVRVAGGGYVGAHLVDLGMDRERGAVDGFVTFYDSPVLVA